MSDSYQAVYDAVRSRISGCDIGRAVESVIRELNITFYFENAMEEVKQAASAHGEPSAIYRPALSIDGDKWCALYGENLQDGVAGFGDSPAEAMSDFNREWYVNINKKNQSAA